MLTATTIPGGLVAFTPKTALTTAQSQTVPGATKDAVRTADGGFTLVDNAATANAKQAAADAAAADAAWFKSWKTWAIAGGILAALGGGYLLLRR